ncbi:MAG: hypothetical protein ACRDK7_16110 [Solirubrobacteraceae bacterium]
MIVDQLQTRANEGRVERSARLRWVGGEFRLRIEVPAGFEPPEEDATAYLLVALPLALYRGEDLQVDGAMSAQTLRQTERIQAIYAAWDPAVRRCRVRVAGELPRRGAAGGQGCLFSRGVDSMYSATSSDSGSLTHLVFCDTLEPIQDARTRAQEWSLVAQAAEHIGPPVLRISTNLRDPGAQLIDYQDMHGAGIAFMGHSLSGGLGRVVIPADLTYSINGASGSHPLLDRLFGSEWLAFDYRGMEWGRPGKVRQLAATYPELLPYLKVCFTENTHANCGRCRKCLVTMISLQAAGALKRASLFPDEIDLDALRKLRIEDLSLRFYWMEAAESLGDSVEDRRVREGVHYVLRRSALPSLAERVRGARAWLKGEREHAGLLWSETPSAFYRNETNVALALLRKGRPFPYGIEAATPQPTPAWSVGPLEPDWGPPLEDSPAQVGLLRLLDRQGRRHRYAIGRVPPRAGVERVGELGALLRERDQEGVPVWLTADGRLSTDRYEPSPSDLDARVLARWTLAPIRWTEAAALAERLREVLRRGIDAVGSLRRTDMDQRGPEDAPAGYLLANGGDGRLALFSSMHPVSGDQLLSTDQGESTMLGYNAPTLLGFLVAEAPASGALGVSRPLIPWASRFGR